MHTPWGASQDSKQIAPGITWYSTASHGGYLVSAARLKEMPESIRAFKPFAGAGWYEEDCDWALVVLAFPDLFAPADCHYAVKSVKSSTSDYYNGLEAYWTTGAAKRAQTGADIFLEQNKDKYAQSGFGGGSEGVWIPAYHLTTQARISVRFTDKQGNVWMKLPQHFTLAEAEVLGAEVITASGYRLVSYVKNEALDAQVKQ